FRRVLFRSRAEQVDGADVGAETALNELDDVGQRLGGVAGHRGEAADVVERPRGRRRWERGGVAHVVGVPSVSAGPSGPDAAAFWSKKRALSRASSRIG